MSAVRLVGVHPETELKGRARLFAALSEAFPSVRFEGREAGARTGLDALIELGGESEARAAAATGTRALAALHPEGAEDTHTKVRLADDAGLDRRLRGQTLPDRHLADAPELECPPEASVLASAGGRPLWTRAGQLDLLAVAASELAPDEPLRARLGRDRSLALLPLLEMLRALSAPDGWQPPPLRATFLLDDPNLHWPSYGHLSLPDLSRHAGEHGYHLALAMVPLDARLAHPGAARLLREQPALSLSVHGNDHFGGELGKAAGEAEALTLAAQALRRSAAFERRTGIAVSRVMVPPHEECSRAMARALARTGFEAVTMTRPYPWLSPPPRDWLTAPDGAATLAGWLPADAAEGLPVLLRHPLAAEHYSSAEVALRAYLDQPLILYGHHNDLAGGLDPLARRSEEIGRLGEVRWGSLAEIAAANVAWRRDGSLLRLRPYSRRVAIEVPAGVDQAVVEPPGFQPGESVLTAAGSVPVGEPFAVTGSQPLQLSLRAADAVAPESVAPPPWRPWPLVRRLAGEARDRVAPARQRLRSGG